MGKIGGEIVGRRKERKEERKDCGKGITVEKVRIVE